MKTMKAMKTKNTMKTTSMNAMKAMKTRIKKPAKKMKKPAAAPRIKVEVTPRIKVEVKGEETPLHPTWPETPIIPPFIPFVFDNSNSLEDGPKDERDALLLRLGYALFQWRSRPMAHHITWNMRGARPDQLEETSLVGCMLEHGICLSLRDPPTIDELTFAYLGSRDPPTRDPPTNEDRIFALLPSCAHLAQ